MRPQGFLDDSQLMETRGLHFQGFSAHETSGASLICSAHEASGAFTLERFSAHEVLLVSLWEMLSSWGFWCFTLKDSQLIKLLVLHFERFLAHEASVASFWKIRSSWNQKILKKSKDFQRNQNIYKEIKRFPRESKDSQRNRKISKESKLFPTKSNDFQGNQRIVKEIKGFPKKSHVFQRIPKKSKDSRRNQKIF